MTLRPMVVRSFTRVCSWLAVMFPAAMFVSGPTSASPRYVRWGTFVRSPMWEFFSSTKVPAFAPAPNRSRAEVAERPHERVLAHGRFDDDRVRADLGARGDPRRTADHGERMDDGIGLEDRFRIDPCALGIDDRDAREHVRLVDAIASAAAAAASSTRVFTPASPPDPLPCARQPARHPRRGWRPSRSGRALPARCAASAGRALATRYLRGRRRSTS